MKQYFLNILVIWHEVRVNYRNRYSGYRLGS
jgi:hypothetical protein